jgi:hypothetical protein
MIAGRHSASQASQRERYVKQGENVGRPARFHERAKKFRPAEPEATHGKWIDITIETACNCLITLPPAILGKLDMPRNGHTRTAVDHFGNEIALRDSSGMDTSRTGPGIAALSAWST